MTVLKLRATCSPAGGYDLDDNTERLDTRILYPVLVLVERASPPAPGHLVGQHVMTESDASMLKAGVDLWNQVEPLAHAVRFEWEGWTPPATNLRLGKIGKVLAMFGIRVHQVDGAPPAISEGGKP